MRTLSISRPDDWHVHFRDNEALPHTVLATATHFGRALVMPNLKPALTSLKELIAYRERIFSVLTHHSFIPYMTFYLNETVRGGELQQIKKHHPYVLGAKLYPAGATTNSEEGVSSLKALYPLLELMQAEDIVLQIHGEVTYDDIYQRERLFIEKNLGPLMRDFPKLRIVLEHISTRAAVEFVTQAPPTIAATITPHHLMFNRNHLLAGGLKPHYYCLPVLKHEQDQKAVQQAAVSGNRKFFAGTDSAPHAKGNKESACGCAGIYSAPFAVAMYAQVFSDLNKLEKLDAFLGRFGAEFYHLPVNQARIELKEQSQIIPAVLPFGQEEVVPVAAGTVLQWSIHESA
ncbi:dihydroorotase [Legionella nagasakiensis]|uniref:dihydroorotase n=1 Tax=Legionella nagasakiensis TaxID=535290 RepID=UPI001055683D|nr:dihydroorotase [Legionella nagasakiensis]